jgi:hypothetical protein
VVSRDSPTCGLHDQAHVDAKARQHVNQAVGTEEIDAPSQQNLLHLAKLKADAAARVRRKRPDVAQCAPQPDERLIRRDSLFKFCIERQRRMGTNGASRDYADSVCRASSSTPLANARA